VGDWELRSAARLLRVLSDLGAAGTITAPQSALAERCRLSVRQVRRLLEKLEEDGFITRLRRGYRVNQKRTQMSGADKDVPSGHKCPVRTKMSQADTRGTENKGLSLTEKPAHKEERACVAAAAFKKHSHKKTAAARPSVAPVVAVLKPYVAGAQQIAVRIFDNARAQIPDITSEELAQILGPQALVAFQRFQDGKVRSIPAVLMAWSRDLLGPEDVEEFRDRQRKERARRNREEQQRLQREQDFAEEQRLKREIQEAWQSLPEEHRSQLRKEYRAELLAKYPKANLWTRDSLESHIESQAMSRWAQRIDDS
jgi:DNA-binding Lrp family transcriptional regulator